jgi:DNA-binding PadR family transcriptional regulator
VRDVAQLTQEEHVFQPSPHAGPRRHHHEFRRGPGPGDMPPGFREMFGRERWGRGALRRGDIRPLILAALADKPMHGYEVIQALEARSGGRWRPSAGSVYPTLQQLADEGLVTSEEIEGRRTYGLTAAGREAAAATPAPTPWNDEAPDAEPDLHRLGMQLIGAVMQVQRVGSAHARGETTRILAEARRQVYRLLADDETGATGDTAAERP